MHLLLHRATNKNRNLSNPPPKKKSKPANKMNVDNRDSLSEFQSSIFDASDGHQLVDFIRKKKGLRAQPQKIFDDVPANRQSLHIEIQRLDIHEHNATHAKETNSQPAEEEIQNQASNENNTRSSVLESPTRQSIRSPTHSKTLMKRLSQSIGRRTLLKEFEKTLQESRFLPPTCSTPVIGDVPPNRTSTMKEKIETVSQGNLNIVCTPITITDEDSSKRENRSKQTADMAEDLQDQVEFVLDRNSKENLLINEACEDSGDDAQDNQHSITLRNRILTPLKAKNRQTFTIERDSVSGNLILSPSKSVARTANVHSHPQTPERLSNARNIILSPSTSVGRTANMHSHSPTPERSSNARNLMLSPSTSTGRTTARYSHPKTPERSLNASRNTKLIVTPKQKQLLLSKFGRSSQGMPSPQKAPSPPRSRIPVFLHGNNAATHAAPEPDPYVESANLSQQHPETVKIIEQLQRQNTSNVPVIVIPVNQTFNQAPNPEPVSSATFVQSPRPLEPAPRASPAKLKSPPPPPSVSSSSSSGESTPVKMNSLRLKDIITDDESSDYHPNFSQSRKIIRRKVKKSSNSSHSRSGVRLSNRPENKLSLTAKPPLNLSKVRQVVKSHQLSRMSDHEILDLRKRNSRGELRQSLKLTQRESSLLGKQMELELLRRNIQARNYEDEVLQMEVLAAPPDEFCDISVQRSKAADPPHQFNDEFVDEMSGDKVSLTQQERYSKSLGGQKPVRKKKKVSEHVERYLETSQKIQKSKYMNLSKRKLYSKGDSEEGSSTECLPLQKPSPPRQPIKRRSSQRKSNNVPSTPPAPPPSTSPPSPSTSPPLPSISPPPPSPTQPTNSPSPQRISMSSHHISNESVKKSVQSEQFLPQNNEVSQKPVKKTKKYQKKAKKPLSPVDPDRGTSFVSVNNQENMCRRSKREKKLPMAYWSSTQTEFRPLYDYNDVVKKVPKKLTKKTPTTEMHLVANTKKVKSNRVAESAKNVKKSTKGHDQQEKSSQSKESEDDVSRERSETPATVLDKQQTTHHVNRRGRPQKKNSKKNNRTAERSDETRFTTSNIVDDPCPNVTLPYTESEKVLLENETTVSNEETSRTMRNHSRELMVKLNPLSKSILSPSIQGSSGYSSDVSSVQQIRLATIDEDSVPTVQQTNINSTMASSNENRLSRELMPPPPSTEFIRSKKSAGKVKNSKKSAFRTEHDQSIADVSSDHLNKLFDQLKNSSVCPSSDVTASLNHNNSGQATAHSRPAESNSILQRKCKNIAILLPRMKVKKPPAHRSEKVCDSGFSSEDMSSVPKQKGDVLLNWLKQMIVNSKSTSGADKGVAKILQADGFHTSSVEDLIFQEVDGVEYAFYDTKQPFSIGYIRFNPKTGKKKCTAKKFELNFVILSGKVSITVNDTKFDCKNGDLITVFIGTSYVIQNISNDPALVMVIKKQCLVN